MTDAVSEEIKDLKIGRALILSKQKGQRCLRRLPAFWPVNAERYS
jgi:hypothetical protein